MPLSSGVEHQRLRRAGRCRRRRSRGPARSAGPGPSSRAPRPALAPAWRRACPPCRDSRRCPSGKRSKSTAAAVVVNSRKIPRKIAFIAAPGGWREDSIDAWARRMAVGARNWQAVQLAKAIHRIAAVQARLARRQAGNRPGHARRLWRVAVADVSPLECVFRLARRLPAWRKHRHDKTIDDNTYDSPLTAFLCQQFFRLQSLPRQRP